VHGDVFRQFNVAGGDFYQHADFLTVQIVADNAAASSEKPTDEAEASAPEATTETDAEATTGDKDADIESAVPPATGEIATNLPVRRMRLPRPVYIADRILPVRRRREDLVDVVISLIAILFIWTIGALASAAVT